MGAGWHARSLLSAGIAIQDKIESFYIWMAALAILLPRNLLAVYRAVVKSLAPSEHGLSTSKCLLPQPCFDGPSFAQLIMCFSSLDLDLDIAVLTFYNSFIHLPCILLQIESKNPCLMSC